MHRFAAAFLFAVSFASITAGAQQPAPKPADPALLAALDREVWTPFQAAFSSGDVEGFIALHSKQYVRPSGDAKRIDGYDAWQKLTRNMFAAFAKREAKATLKLRFIERIANAEAASERGIYEFTMNDPKAGARTAYGKFHVLSRREDGRWKVVMDYDSSEGGTINEASFRAAHAMEDHAKF